MRPLVEGNRFVLRYTRGALLMLQIHSWFRTLHAQASF